MGSNPVVGSKKQSGGKMYFIKTIIKPRAYLEIISSNNQVAIAGIIKFPDGREHFFYNKQDGWDKLEEYFKNQLIDKEDLIFLENEINNSQLTPASSIEVDKKFAEILSIIEKQATIYSNKDFIIEKIKKQFPEYPSEIANCLLRFSLLYNQPKNSAIN